MFPGAVATRTEAEYALVGAPLDISTTFQPGTRFGPSRIREMAETFEDYDQYTGQHLTELGVYDHGDIHPGHDTAEYLEFLRGTLSDYSESGTVPMVVGGEHTVTVSAVRALEPDVYVTLDAHLDLRKSYAGNPLSHATVTHHALEHADEAIILGGRSGNEDEYDRATAEDVTVVPPADVDDWRTNTGEASLFEGKRVYLSVDIDAADPGFAPGTGTPEPFGLDPQTMHRLVRDIAPSCVGFDVVEVNDRDDGQAAALGGKLLRSFVFAHAADS